MSVAFFAPILAGLDPTRLSLPGPQSFTNTAFIPNVSFMSIQVNTIGTITLGAGGDDTTPPVPDYAATANAWWGRNVARPSGVVPGGLLTPGNYWEARADIISGSFPTPGGTFGAWSRIASGAFNTIWQVTNSSVPSASGTIRVSFRRFGSTTTSGTVDFTFTLNLV